MKHTESIKPKLSIITVCLNQENSILKTIESIRNQTYKNYEHIIIDGCSTDSTVLKIKNSNHKCHLISEKDNGIYDAQNKGASFAKGEYLLFLNGGDSLATNNILTQVFENPVSADILYGDIVLENSEGLKELKKSPSELSWEFFLTESLFHPCTFIRKDFFNKIGAYKTKYSLASDYDFFLNSFKKSPRSFKKINLAISIFPMDGRSSDPRNWRKIQIERLKSQIGKIPFYFMVNFYGKKIGDKICQKM